ncbi:MAG: HAMP domain-containing histidine kinase [Candidatus Thorarchaeota archaeon]|nr:HAMP domain-containing histidine kinase [Candidatus Thorarchaeota archaeon]
MQGTRRVLLKILILVPLAILSAVLVLGPGGIISYTPETRASVNSLLAYWISAPAAIGIIAYIKRPLRAHLLLTSAFTFAILIHIGSAANNLFILSQESTEFLLTNTVMDLLEMAIIGLLIFFASVCYTRPRLVEQARIASPFILLAIFLPSGIYGFVSLTIYSGISDAILNGFAWVFGVIAIVSFFAAIIFISRIQDDILSIDLGFFLSSLFLLIGSTVTLIISMSYVSITWVLAESLQIASFLLIGLALCVPVLKKTGFSRYAAYGLVLGLLMMAYVPLLVTIIIESASLNIIFQELNLLAFLIIHIGAGSLSGMMAILLYIYAIRNPQRNYYPLIILFGLWSIVTLTQIFSITYPTFNEPLVTYIVGSILSLVLLFLAIRFTVKPPEKKLESFSNARLLGGFAIVLCLIVIGELINQYAITTYSELDNNPIGNAILLGTNLIVILELAFLIFMIADISRGISPIELYITYFLAMWIIPNILKSYYGYWTAGWWVSEFLLFAGLLAGPPILAWFYIRMMQESEESHARANLYADLLMHDVTNYNQMVLTSLELLGSGVSDNRSRVHLAQDGTRAISLSEQLISNVRLLSGIEGSPQNDLEPMNLVSTIVRALDAFTQQSRSDNITIEFKPDIDSAYVLGNELLQSIFLNIFYSALEYNEEKKIVTVDIMPIKQSNQTWWHIVIEIPGRWIKQGDQVRFYNRDTESYSGSALGLMASRIMIERLGGTFSIQQKDIDSNRLRTRFLIRLLESNPKHKT